MKKRKEMKLLKKEAKKRKRRWKYLRQGFAVAVNLIDRYL